MAHMHAHRFGTRWRMSGGCTAAIRDDLMAIVGWEFREMLLVVGESSAAVCAEASESEFGLGDCV